ncbi:Group 2/22 mite allergen-like protein (lipid binding protein) [Euroglyphus maynei]|uniref:Group 2/22 mite allergen-like protein (Lipid binding protein) n=1 Tax=Euroglyphus maynei TaxID=6958 RepID=A0A1Y3B4E2_EURMA|nr:Group 2/22 mite allergen-like protein (lipid binding protein) [Euroglyphus maynei]
MILQQSFNLSSSSLLLMLLLPAITLSRTIIKRESEQESDADDGLMEYNDCGNGNLRRLKVEGCEPNEEIRSRFCLLTRGSNASLVAKFIADSDYPTVTTDVRIKIGFLEFGYPPIEYDACMHYVACPLHEKELSVARVTFPIHSFVPRFGSMLITARLYGPNGEVIVCGQARAGLI